MRKEKTERQEKGKKSTIERIIDIVFLIFAVFAFVTSAFIYYTKVYLTPFFVNGQSMYPTLNAETLNTHGTLAGETGGGSLVGYKNLDYGLMDTHKRAIDKIERFDIIITYSTSAMSTRLIKRVVGLPGETIKFTSTNQNDPENGDLYVKDGDEFVLVPQPIEDKYKVSDNAHPYAKTEIVLGDDEYYVLGDNRAHSSDSRVYGKLKKEWIVGKVVALTGHCDLAKDENGEDVPVNFKRLSWPRFM